ncbi:MAG: hypothetical protein LHV69_09685 [Elusimicrobia bacterium]|nr:hypothetical protein [Candidatus Obscuribacterium magneticum]
MAPVQFVVSNKGKKTGVFLSYTKFVRLMEDLHDLTVVAERRAEKPVSVHVIRKRLRKHGIV